MKKLFCLILAIIMFSLTGCSSEVREPLVASPLKELNTVYDSNGNLIQQILYNDQTDEYIMKEYIYACEDGYFICADQRTTITGTKKKANQDISNKLTIYYNQDLLDRPITIMDNEYVKVSVVEYLAKDNWWEFGYKLEVINKTTQVITIMIDDVYIMDIECKPMFSVEHIEAGKTSRFILAWDKETIERCYIPYLDNTEFMIKVYDNEDWKVPALAGSRVMFKQ